MNKKLRHLNPFALSPVIPDDLFCDRKTETETLIRYVTNGSNVLLMSPRRMGKSGLIHHVFNQPEIRKRYATFYIDIYETSTLEEFIQKFGQEIVRQLSRVGWGPLNGFLRSLASLRGVFSLDPASGMPSFSVGIGEITRPEMTLDEIFSYLENAGKPCIVAIVITLVNAAQAPWNYGWDNPQDEYAKFRQQQSADSVNMLNPVQAENIGDTATAIKPEAAHFME